MHSLQLIDARPRQGDPTGTSGLRRSFRAAAKLRLRQLRSQLRIAVMEHNLLGLGGLAENAASFQPADVRLKAFNGWLEAVAPQMLGGAWLSHWVAKAWLSGAQVAVSQVGDVGLEEGSGALLTLAQAELDGITAALVQQVTREAARALAHSKLKRSRVWQRLARVIDKIGEPRLCALANTITVMAHNHGRGAVYREAGFDRVGITPEHDSPLQRDAMFAQDKREGPSRARVQEEYGENLVGVATAGDDAVCFPAGTLITTDEGDRPIESIRCGDRVLTRFGFCVVARSIRRQYFGKLFFVVSDHASFVCTADHPVWCERLGFAQARKLQSGDRLQLADNQFTNVRSVVDLSFVDTNNAPSGSLQRAILFLSAASITMPVCSVNFDSDEFGQRKIDRVSAEACFLLEWYAQIVQGNTDDGFDPSFAFESSIAGQRTKSWISRWLATECCTALFARENVWGSAAFFRAVSMFRPLAFLLSLPKLLLASFATHISFIDMLLFARPRAEIVAVGNRSFGDRKRLVAPDAGFGNGVSSIGIITSARTKSSPCYPFETGRGSRIATLFAGLLRRFTPTECRHEGVVVYNLTVAGAPEYFANGILVHNCQECEDFADGGPYDIDEALDVLPAHPGCRCSIYPWREDDTADDSATLDSNPNHEPAGSPEGGQFASGGNEGAESAADREKYATEPLTDDGRSRVGVVNDEYRGIWGGSREGSSMITGYAAKVMDVEGYKDMDATGDARNLGNKFLKAIHDSYGSSEPLFHSFENTEKIEWKEGDIVRLPLIAASGEKSYGYAINYDGTDERNANATAFEFSKGTKFAGYLRWDRENAADFGHQWAEAIVAGEFKVAGTYMDHEDGYRQLPVKVVKLEPVAVFNPVNKVWEKV